MIKNGIYYPQKDESNTNELLEKIKKGELGNKAGKGFYIYK